MIKKIDYKSLASEIKIDVSPYTLEEIFTGLSSYLHLPITTIEQYFRNNQIKVKRCNKSAGYNSRLYNLFLYDGRELFLKHILYNSGNSSQTTSGVKIKDVKPKDSFEKERLFFNLFNKFNGFAPNVIFSSFSILFSEYYKTSLDEYIHDSFENNLNNFTSIDHLIKKFIDIYLINACIVEQVFKNNLLDTEELSSNRSEILSRLKDKEIEKRTEEFFINYVPFFKDHVVKGSKVYKRFSSFYNDLMEEITPFESMYDRELDESDLYMSELELFNDFFSAFDNASKYKNKLDELEEELEFLKEEWCNNFAEKILFDSDLYKNIPRSKIPNYMIKYMVGLAEDFLNKLIMEDDLSIYNNYENLNYIANIAKTFCTEELIVKIKSKKKEYGIWNKYYSNYDEFIRFNTKFADEVKKANKVSKIDFIYNGKKRKFTIGPEYLCLDGHPGNCLIKDSSTIDTTESKFKGEDIIEIVQLIKSKLRSFNKTPKFKKQKRLEDLLEKYKGLAVTDFNKFGKVSLPYVMAIFLSYPTMFDIPLKKKMSYVDYAITQQLRIYLKEDISLDDPCFKDIKAVWYEKFKIFSIYVVMKNMNYLHKLIKDEKTYRNFILVGDKKYLCDKTILAKEKNFNYLRELLRSDKRGIFRKTKEIMLRNISPAHIIDHLLKQ